VLRAHERALGGRSGISFFHVSVCGFGELTLLGEDGVKDVISILHPGTDIPTEIALCARDRLLVVRSHNVIEDGPDTEAPSQTTAKSCWALHDGYEEVRQQRSVFSFIVMLDSRDRPLLHFLSLRRHSPKSPLPISFRSFKGFAQIYGPISASSSLEIGCLVGEEKSLVQSIACIGLKLNGSSRWRIS
jgi:hypothetical protein